MKPVEKKTKIRFLDAEIAPPSRADWIMWIIAVPIVSVIGTMSVGASSTALGVLFGFTLSAFGVSVLRAPKAFFTLLGCITVVYALIRVTFE